MTTEHSTYTYEDGAQETVALTRGRLTPHGHALLKINYSDGRTADCYVNTAWLRDRLDDLGEPRPVTSDTTPTANEGVRYDGDYWHPRWAEQYERAEKAERDLATAQFEAATLRADRDAAEEERDEARASERRASERWRKELTLRNEVADELRRLRATQSRPLTPDAITDEMVERAAERYRGLPTAMRATDRARVMLRAALTEPPARPEGAEDWEDWLIEAMPHESMPDEDIALLADRIAQRLNEEQP